MSETPRIKVPSTPKVKDKNQAVPEWHTQQELILKRWSEIGSSYRYLHDKSFKKFNTQNMWFALPVIVISTITGTANFAQGSFPNAWKEFVPLGIGFLNLSAGLITTVSQFLRVSELLEGHRAASIAYSKFARNISVELSLPVKERTEDGSVFIANCRAELDRLIEQSPDIPEDIVNAFEKISSKDKKIIFAHSYGSLVAVSAVLRKKINPDYLILSAPHFDDNYPKFVKNMSGIMAKVFPKLRAPSPITKKNLSTDKETVENYFNDPLVFRSLTFKFGNEITNEQKFVNKNIEELKIPTLVLHGDEDKVVPIKASEQISKLENVKFITVENSKHEILNQDTRTFVLSEIHYWFRDNNII